MRFAFNEALWFCMGWLLVIGVCWAGIKGITAIANEFDDFVGVSQHNTTGGPIHIRVKCFEGEHSWGDYVIADGDQDKYPLTCPKR